MYLSYSTKLTLCVEEIKPEELLSVLNRNSDSMIGPAMVKMEPEYMHDIDGNPYRLAGTYMIEFSSGELGYAYDLDTIVQYIKESYEQLKTLESQLKEESC